MQYRLSEDEINRLRNNTKVWYNDESPAFFMMQIYAKNVLDLDLYKNHMAQFVLEAKSQNHLTMALLKL
jgi:hypothetical protein